MVTYLSAVLFFGTLDGVPTAFHCQIEKRVKRAGKGSERARRDFQKSTEEGFESKGQFVNPEPIDRNSSRQVSDNFSTLDKGANSFSEWIFTMGSWGSYFETTTIRN